MTLIFHQKLIFFLASRWSNSSRNAKKFFHLGDTPSPPGLDQPSAFSDSQKSPIGGPESSWFTIFFQFHMSFLCGLPSLNKIFLFFLKIHLKKLLAKKTPMKMGVSEFFLFLHFQNWSENLIPASSMPMLSILAPCGPI